MDSAESAFKLRQEFDVVQEEVEPVVEGNGVYGNFQLVGHGSITDVLHCGAFLSFKGCKRVDLHEGEVWKGQDCTGKAYVRVVHHWCNNSRCPRCFESGFSVREAGKIEQRLVEGAKRFGLVQHIVASVPLKDYGLSFEDMRGYAVKALVARSVVGGVVIFHGFRFANLHESLVRRVPFGWRWSPHFHCLGYILSGFRECRRCEFVDDKGSRYHCEGCKGFYGRSKEHFKNDGFVVEVMGEREKVFAEYRVNSKSEYNIFGTVYYQLNHSSIDVTKKRFHVAVWFGVCSYRKLKVTKEKRKELCPICGEELEKLFHVGVRRIVKTKGERGYVGCFLDGLVDSDGSPNWVSASKSTYG